MKKILSRIFSLPPFRGEPEGGFSLPPVGGSWRGAFVLLAFLLCSCDKFLNITPEGQVSRDDILASQSGVEDALYGCYAKMRTANLYGSNMTFGTMDVLAHQLSCKGNTTVEALQVFNYENTSVQDIMEKIWTAMYNNISNVNSVLNGSDVSAATTYPYRVYRGEALALRAFMHFDLVRLFAPQITRQPKADGIPYATQFAIVTPDFEPLEKNYEHILADLLLAEQLLDCEKEYKASSSFIKDRQIHLNLHAVRATLARVYLTMGKRTEALNYAQKVIEQSGCRLATPTSFTVAQHGMMYGEETLFGLYYQKWYDEIVGAKLQSTTSFSSYDPSASLLANYVNTDRRGGDSRSGFFGYNDGSSTLRLMKLSDENARLGVTTTTTDKIPGINLIKLCEMYYIAAECLLDSDPVSAARYLHDVYDSRGVTYSDADAVTIDEINRERYREMVGEGQEFFSRKRQHIAFPAVKLSASDADPSPIQPSDAIFTPPIPKIEIEYRE